MDKKIKQFLKFVIPSVLSMFIFNSYVMVDGIFVAQFVGETALSALNIYVPYINFIFALTILFSVGTSTVISIYKAQGNHQKANETFTKNTIVIASIAIILTLLVSYCIEPFALFLGASTSTLPYVLDYLGLLVCFSFFYMVSYSLEVMVKIDGFPILSTIGIITGAITNLTLDAVFILVFDMGIKGSVLATGLSQVFTFLVFFIHFLRHKGTLRWCKFKPDFSVYKRILPIGLADFINEFSAGLIIFMFNHSILTYIGEDGIISYSVISYIYNIVMMTFAGISQGTQPLISYAYGQENDELCHTYFKYANIACFVFSIIALVICLFGTKYLVMIFISPDSKTLFNDTLIAFRTFSLSYIFMGYNLVMAGYFAVIERSKNSFTIMRGFLLIAFSIYLTTHLFGGNSLWYSTLLCESLCLCISIYLYKKYKNRMSFHLQINKKKFLRKLQSLHDSISFRDFLI